MIQYSVLMSVYCKEKAEFFHQSIESMLSQTVPTNDFVIVCDGPLTPELDKVIFEKEQANPDLFQIIRLAANQGTGKAANEGLKYCKNDLVAKMDSDDISRPLRCERLLEKFSESPQLSIVGGHLAEFVDTPDNIVAVRRVPQEHADILAYAKRRMPFNNQTVMYRKAAVHNVGGYSDLRRCQDYDLYVRMLQNGCLACNCDEVFVDFRLNVDAYQRRGSWATFFGFVSVRWRMFISGFSDFFDFIVPTIAQTGMSILPNNFKNIVYKKFLR